MIVSAAWIGAIVLAALNEIAIRRVNGNSWAPQDILFVGSGEWLAWAILASGIFAMSRRWPIAGAHLARRVALHLGLTLRFWVAASAIFQCVLAVLFNPQATEGATTSPQLFQKRSVHVTEWIFTTFPLSVVVYAVGVGTEHAIRYFAEAREREIQMIRLSEQLIGAQYAALQAQLNPYFLFNTLNSIVVRAQRRGRGHGATGRAAERGAAPHAGPSSREY